MCPCALMVFRKGGPVLNRLTAYYSKHEGLGEYILENWQTDQKCVDILSIIIQLHVHAWTQTQNLPFMYNVSTKVET